MQQWEINELLRSEVSNVTSTVNGLPKHKFASTPVVITGSRYHCQTSSCKTLSWNSAWYKLGVKYNIINYLQMLNVFVNSNCIRYDLISTYFVANLYIINTWCVSSIHSAMDYLLETPGVSSVTDRKRSWKYDCLREFQCNILPYLHFYFSPPLLSFI